MMFPRQDREFQGPRKWLPQDFARAVHDWEAQINVKLTSLAASKMVASWDLSPHSARNVRVKDWSKMGDSRPKKRLCVWPPRIIPVSTSLVTELDFSFSSWKCQSHHKYFNFVKFLFNFFFYINLCERIEGFIEISILATSNFAGTPQSIMSYQLIRLNSLATTLWCGK